MKDAIQVCELKKSYGSHMVLKGLDFQIEKGEIFALLGVNGAGKTTTLECIEGLRKYDSGAITVNGKWVFSYNHHLCPPISSQWRL